MPLPSALRNVVSFNHKVKWEPPGGKQGGCAIKGAKLHAFDELWNIEVSAPPARRRALNSSLSPARHRTGAALPCALRMAVGLHRAPL